MNATIAIGRKLSRDIFSKNGVLLVPAYTALTRKQITLLENHGISLADDDFLPETTDAEILESQKMIDDAVRQVNELFDEVREGKRVPMEEFRKEVIPVIEEATHSKSLFGLIKALQSKDDYTYRHNLAVGAFSGLIGSWLGLDCEEQLALTTAAFLHDIGKMLVPEEILNKSGPLTDEEYAVMKSHTIRGFEILKKTEGIDHRQALVALQHHERMDGSGYPFGLTGSRIDFFSRIVAVADVFHAMTSQRVYRNPSPFYEVLAQMEKDAFGVLDPAVAKLFISKIMNTLIGRTVLLSDGSTGTILLIHTQEPTRPLVLIGDEFVNLQEKRSLNIMLIL